MKKLKFILCLCLCVVVFSFAACADEYNVETPHVIINQIFGGNGGYLSHNFIELYNPTDDNINLNGWAVHYKPSQSAKIESKWYKLELTGEIPSKHSYLINCGEDSEYPSDVMYNTSQRKLTSFDAAFDFGGGGDIIKTKV
ncbi:MAG: lamin tail domain-containing protein, partial [Synergistaceae bacterium]|nr:lamin tail domain-containing protein [Synergistaceae bacterium]